MICQRLRIRSRIRRVQWQRRQLKLLMKSGRMIMILLHAGKVTILLQAMACHRDTMMMRTIHCAVRSMLRIKKVRRWPYNIHSMFLAIDHIGPRPLLRISISTRKHGYEKISSFFSATETIDRIEGYSGDSYGK